MIVAVTGGRDYADRDNVWGALDHVHHLGMIRLLVHGGATGADALAREWAEERGILHVAYPYISELGKAGGPVRNRQMLTGARPHVLVAFRGGAGTRNCVETAIELGIKVLKEHP